MSIVPSPTLIVMPRLLWISRLPSNLSVPPSSVIFPAVKLAGAAPRFASEVICTAPPLMFVPLCEFVPENVSVPVPILVIAPPPIAPAIVKLFPPVSMASTPSLICVLPL